MLDVAAWRRHCVLLEQTLTCVCWDAGYDAQVHLVPVGGNTASALPSDERLVGRGEPLCCAFDGPTLVIGFASGALSGFGIKGFLRWHVGAVGAVGIISSRNTLVSAAADGSVCMWDRVRVHLLL